VSLYCRRVLIDPKPKKFLPDWMRFVRGVVDSEDLPLNVSREVLQRDATTRFIRKQVIGKTVGLLEELAAEGETTVEKDGKQETRNRYLVFWKSFGRVLKEGVYHDAEWRERLAGLLRFEGSRGELTGLKDYVARMPESQKAIYYVAADTLAAARSSPHLEAVKKHGYEVLYFTDPVDEWLVDAMTEYGGKPFASVAKGDLDLPVTEVEKQQRESKAKDLKPVLERAQKALAAKIKEVRVTDRLTDSPACLVAGEHGMSARQERVLREAGHDLPPQQRILELNPDHPVVKKLQGLQDEQQFAEWAGLLYDQALLAEGVLPDDPGAFAKKVADLMGR
jgi:molecular chaperone HtpG